MSKRLTYEKIDKLVKGALPLVSMKLIDNQLVYDMSPFWQTSTDVNELHPDDRGVFERRLGRVWVKKAREVLNMVLPEGGIRRADFVYSEKSRD